jgi:uncharacterized protein (TIGR00255 family)
MINSMTGYGRREAKVESLGTVRVEIRSTNHKFLETVLHVPEGFLALEEKIKKEIEVVVKRGRVTCAINITARHPENVFINKALLKKYASELKRIKKQLNVQGDLSLDTLVGLPGVLTLEEEGVPAASYWPSLKNLLAQASRDLAGARQKEGAA